MADEAIKVLQQAIDTARSEGHAEGYAEGFTVAMRMVQEFSASASAPERSKSRSLKDRPRPVPQRSVPKGRVRLTSDAPPYAPRIAREVADAAIEEAYKAISPRAAGPAEIQYIVKQAGTDLPGTSVRRAIDRLTTQNKIRQIPATKTWVYEAGGTAGSTEGSEPEVSRGDSAPGGAKGGNGAAPMHA
jgi:hypothetical protein